MLGCLVFTIGTFLTYFTLDTSPTVLSVTYGVIIASSANLITLSTILLTVPWFPNHRGKVMGVITSGYGLSSTIFAPIQTLIINPANIAPVQKENSSSFYFEPEVLDNFPSSFLYLGGIYSVLFILGISMTAEKQSKDGDDDGPNLSERLR